MKMLYLANVRMPTEKAHGAQIAKACEAFAALGVDVELVVPRRWTPITEDPFTYYGIQKNFRITVLPTPDMVRSFGRFGFILQILFFGIAAGRYARAHETEVVYGRDEHILFFALLFGAKRVVWESHDGAWNRFARFVARRAEHMVVVTRAQKEFYVARGVAEEKMVALPNGVDLEAFKNNESREVARRRLGLPTDRTLVLYVGALGGWKGTDTLLAASLLLPSNLRVVIIGGSVAQLAPLREKYPSVIFLGERPYRELPSNLSAGDVLVLPNTGHDLISVSFTSPLKLLAYMAAGKPIVASDLPSVRELVSEREAVLVPADDPVALSAGIQRALGEEGIGERARARVAQYSWNARAQRILDFIHGH